MKQPDLSLLSVEEAEGLRTTLSALVDGARDALGHEVVGVYLVGSFAIGAGDGHSDVDFAVVTRERASDAAASRLEELHDRLPLCTSFGADHLEGSYVSLKDLKTPSRADWLYVDNGSRSLERSDHDDSLAFRWVLRNHGVALYGAEPNTLLAKIDERHLKEEARVRAESWQALLASSPETVDDSWAQTYFVTGLSRLLYTFEHAGIVSKNEATRWAIDRLDPAWRGLLENALTERETTWARVGTRADPSLSGATIRFSEAVMREMQN